MFGGAAPVNAGNGAAACICAPGSGSAALAVLTVAQKKAGLKRARLEVLAT
jgi:hypothetical protein